MRPSTRRARSISRRAITATKVGDHVSKNLFEELIRDEEGHIDFLEAQLELYGSIGAQDYGQLDALPADQAEKDDAR